MHAITPSNRRILVLGAWSASSALVRTFRARGIDVLVCETVADCLKQLRFAPCHLCVVTTSANDASLVRERIQSEQLGVPLLAIAGDSARQSHGNTIIDQVVAALGQKAVTPRGYPITVGQLVIDPSTYDAHYAGERLDLSRRQFDLLYLLGLRLNHAIPRSELAEQLGVGRASQGLRHIDILVCRLRQKLADSGDPRITTKPGFGYMLRSSSREVATAEPTIVGSTASGLSSRTKIGAGDLVLDEDVLDAYRGSQPLDLTRSQFQLLRLLAGQAGETLSPETIAAGLDLQPGPKARKVVKTQVSRLREKLSRAESSAKIVTEKGRGWSLA